MSQARDERRFKVLWITADAMLHMVSGWKPNSEGQRGYVLEGLPDGWEVDSVCYDWHRHAFGVRLFHESFDPVTEGEAAPDLLITVRDLDIQPDSTRKPVRFREFL